MMHGPTNIRFTCIDLSTTGVVKIKHLLIVNTLKVEIRISYAYKIQCRTQREKNTVCITKHSRLILLREVFGSEVK